jgi:predicted  nucleic acid-binding Zn-ribbon protein
MFDKKKCSKCGKKIGKGYSYCPYCGNNLRDKVRDEKDYGFLGRNDGFGEDFFNEQKLPFGMNFLFKNLIKEMDKQFKALDKEIGKEMQEKARKEIKKPKQPGKNKIDKGGISINISSKNGVPTIKVKSFGNIPKFQNMEKDIEKKDRKKEKKMPVKKISKEKAKKIAKLPREEAESKVRRVGDRVIYEIELPGVKNMEDVFINKLENSIEIKAFSKNKAYFKFLPVTLSLLKHKLEKEKLILELGEK